MNSLTRKRPRLDMSVPNESLSAAIETMHRMKGETELVTLKRPGVPDTVRVLPTYKALLSAKGYLVQQTLGSGTYSKVKKAICPDGGYAEKVAIKLIDRQRAPKDYQIRFMPRELEVWPRLNHPNIVKLYEHFRDERREYMILEYAPRGDVLKFIQQTGATSEYQARKWSKQLCGAVKYMHDMDITHRDLKLENLLIDSFNNIKLADFGFVKPNSSKIKSQTYCGSKSYAAPEILEGRPYEPHKADIWAIGVIMYIMTTGKMPFDETKGTKYILQQQRALDLIWPHPLATSCKELIKRMFCWDSRDRPDINEVLSNKWFHITMVMPKQSKTTHFGCQTQQRVQNSHTPKFTKSS